MCAQNSSFYQGIVLGIQQQIEADDLGSARESIISAMKRYPNDGGLENLLGIVEIQSGHSEAAKQAFALAIAHSPKLSSAHLNLARIDMETADHDAKSADEAFRLYRRVLELDPLNSEAAYGAATVAMWRRQYAISLANLSKLSTETRTKARVQAVLCADELGLGHSDAAKRIASAMAASPDLSEGDVMLVLPGLRAAHLADLLDTLFSAANAHQPLSASGLRMLGLSQEAEGKWQQAHETMERVYTMNPSGTAPLIDLARLSLAANNKQEALGYLAHARSLAPNDANLAYEYGFVCLEMNLLREARLAIGEAVKLAPDTPEYNLTMGTVSSGADALPYLRKYHDLRPDDVVGYLAFGIAYFGNNDFQDALVWFTKAAAKGKTAATAHYYLGRILNQQGKYNEAIEQLRESAALQPDQPEVSAELGEAYLSLKQYPAAAAMLQRALELDPDNYVANYALVRLYAQTGDPRRNKQVERFKALRDKNEEQYHDAMRIIEARPQFVSSDTQ
jgi:tetratricopeptide (TPR) repeat protein